MAFAAPVTLEGAHVRLEPMTHARADAIAVELGRAAADGAMWESKVTTIPRPEGARAYVAQALDSLDPENIAPVRDDRPRERQGGRLDALHEH